LANTLGWIATGLDAQGNFERAIAAQAEKIATLTKVPDAEHDRYVQELQAVAHQLTARSWLSLGHAEAATTELTQAVRVMNELVAVDSANQEWLYHLGNSDLDAADLARWRGQPSEARHLLGNAVDHSRQWLAGNSGNTRWRISLQGRRLTVAAHLAQAPQRATVTADLQAYLKQVARDVAAGAVLDLPQTQTVAEAALICGDLLAEGHRTDEARGTWQTALLPLQALGSSGGPAAITLQAHHLQRLGRVQEARALADTVQASHYRHPLYAELRQRLASATEKRAGE
jgi:tetratricopeptide (TPR) repeat protein